jgi:hypothetical protein
MTRGARLASVLLALSAALPLLAEDGYLYRAQFVQAAPGRLVELIDLVKSRKSDLPFVLRHSQGDRWDLLLLMPMGSYADFYSPERVARRRSAAVEGFSDLVAWREDLFVLGPPLPDVRQAFSGAGFFHLEIFQALPGRQADLLAERKMENAYQKALKRPENFIFVRDAGAAWDLFTIGFYRDLKHYAESGDIPEADQEAAAKAAGFESASRIGAYLRRFISQHHDTLAVPVK